MFLFFSVLGHFASLGKILAHLRLSRIVIDGIILMVNDYNNDDIPKPC